MIICPWKDISRYEAVIPGLQEAVEAINSHDPQVPGTYPLPNGRFMVGVHKSHGVEGAKAEAHRKFLDIQYVVTGQDVVGWAPLSSLTPAGEFNAEGDIGFYNGPVELIRVPAGYCYVVFPEDAHMPDCHIDEPNDFLKIVVKLAL